MGIEFSPIVQWPERPVWRMWCAAVHMKILSIKNRNRTVDLVNEYYYHIVRTCSEYFQLYTDGSKDSQKEVAGAAVLVPSLQISRVDKVDKTSDNLNVYAVELCALHLVVK